MLLITLHGFGFLPIFGALQWGKVHYAEFPHPLSTTVQSTHLDLERVPLGGDAHTVAAAGYGVDEDFVTGHKVRGVAVLQGGAWPFHSAYDSFFRVPLHLRVWFLTLATGITAGQYYPEGSQRRSGTVASRSQLLNSATTIVLLHTPCQVAILLQPVAALE